MVSITHHLPAVVDLDFLRTIAIQEKIIGNNHQSLIYVDFEKRLMRLQTTFKRLDVFNSGKYDSYNLL